MKKNSSERNLQSFYKQLKAAKKDLRNKNMYELLLRRVEGKSVLDIGSGAGHFLKILQENRYHAEGVEPDKKLINMSNDLYDDFPKVHNIAAEDIDQIKKKFHTVTLIDVLEHIEDDLEVLNKIKRILGDGKIIIFVPANQFLYSDRDRQIGHFRRYSMSELKNKLKKAGYEIEEARHWNMIGFFVYLLFEKILNKSLNKSSFRTNSKKGVIKSTARKLLDFWMGRVENNVNFGFGLSLLIVARNK